MKTIWKFPLELVDRPEVEMPATSRVLSVAPQNGSLCVWALCEPSDPGRVVKQFAIFGTGREVPENIEAFRFLGTVLMAPFVWHVFEVLE